MIVLSHRGYWREKTESNTELSFKRAWMEGFGVETDVRDFGGRLVVSHDPPFQGELYFESFLGIYSEFPNRKLLALNIKSDGLSEMIREMLAERRTSNYFVFDMSVPDGLSYLKAGLKVFTRQSEYEQSPSFYEQAKGVWLDEFHGHWITSKIIEGHINNGKKVAIVSPELHGRGYEAEWEDYRKVCSRVDPDFMMICTDFPDLATDYFNA